MAANGIYRASRKSTNQKTGKTYWNQVGLTVWIGEYKGEPSVSVVDERTGERYPCFPPRPKESGGGSTDSGYDEGVSNTDDGSGVPF
jgi:hypothetical protein